MEWRADWNGTPAMDLAQEEVTLAAVAESARLSLLVYGWDRPTLVLGYGQNSSEVNLAACQARGVAVVRRCTGGAGVLYKEDLAMSLVLPETHPWARSIGSLYGEFVAALQAGLHALGVTTTRSQTPRHGGPRSAICFEDHRAETLLLEGKKVLGCAQARRRGAVLVHGALLLGVDAELQSAVYGVSRERIEALLGTVPEEAYTTREALAKHLAQSLAGALGERVIPFRGVAQPAAGLPQELASRLHDPKWVIVGSEE
jgi:lipoate-protein ligase A